MGEHHKATVVAAHKMSSSTKKKRKRSSKSTPSSTTTPTSNANNLMDAENSTIIHVKESEGHDNNNDDEKIEQPSDANVVEDKVLKEEDIQHDPPTNDNDDDGDDTNKAKRKRKRKRKAKKDDEEGDDTSPPNDAQQQKMTSLDHTVYVEGIPFDCTEEDVKQWFVSHNCADILQMRLSRWQDTGRLRGYGHVVFDTQESRLRALQELNGKSLGKRYLSIVAPNAPKANTTGSMMMMATTTMSTSTGSTPREQPEGCKVVFVKNLPYHATEDDILASFQVCGKILDGGIRIARNSATRQSKGFAYVEYKNPEGAHGAVQKASKPFGLKVLDRPVFVDYDEGRMKGSYKTEDGRLWTKEFGKKQTKTK